MLLFLLCFKVNTDYGTLRLGDCEVEWTGVDLVR